MGLAASINNIEDYQIIGYEYVTLSSLALRMIIMSFDVANFSANLDLMFLISSIWLDAETVFGTKLYKR